MKIKDKMKQTKFQKLCVVDISSERHASGVDDIISRYLSQVSSSIN